MKNSLIALTCMMTVALAACGDGEQMQIPVQRWKDMDVRIETHPNPPVAGMSEIVTIVTGPHGKPISNMTVSYRSSDTMPWVQAIQDGRIGVYRRAVDLGAGAESMLQVRLDQAAEQKTLLYPLKLEKE